MRYAQPQSGPVLVESAHPSAKGLFAAYDFAVSTTNLVDNKPLVLGTSVAKATGPIGVGVGGSGFNAGLAFPDYSALVSATGEATILAVLQNGTTADQGLWMIGSQSNTQASHYPFSGVVYLSDFMGVADGRWVNGVSPVIPLNQPHVLTIQFKNGQQRAAQNGKTFATNTLAQAAQFPNLSRLNLSSASGGSPYTYSGQAATVFIWNRYVPDAELAALSANPWQLFKSPQRVMLAAAGGTNTPINPGAGAFALTGYAPSVTQSANLSLTPGAGSISITGYAPTIAQPNTISPGVGSLAVTGYAPTVTQAANQAVTPGAGSLTLTGYAPAVAQTAGQWIVPGAGLLSISGYAPTITQPQTVAPGSGSLAITGYAPTVTQAINQNIVPGAGTLALSGYAPSIAQSANQFAQPAAGSLSLTGYAPLVAQSVNQFIAPSVGSLTITGFAPVITQVSASPNLQPGAGLLSIVGYAPTVEQSTPITKIGGDDAPRHDEEDERVEVWEKRAPTPRRDQALDTVLREAYAKTIGKPAAPAVAKAEPKPVAPAEPAFDVDEEDDLEVLLLSF